MYIAIVIGLGALGLAIILFSIFKEIVQFSAVAFNEGFYLSEVRILWLCSKQARIKEPHALFVSISAMNAVIATLIENSRASTIAEIPRIQMVLTKLYDYRTKLELAHANKCGLAHTRYLTIGQKIRVVLKGRGVFTSSILNNGRELTVRVPSIDGRTPIVANAWVDKTITVYLWRKGDASYVFDTRVTEAGYFNGIAAIHLAPTANLLRTQKRMTIRRKCKIPAELFFIPADRDIDYEHAATEGGYRCLLEDISEKGALVRVAGKGLKRSHIRLQFFIGNEMILMFGIVRAVEYNRMWHQSRLHFECVHVDTAMRNTVLSFVYKVLPQDAQEAYEAFGDDEDDFE